MPRMTDDDAYLEKVLACWRGKAIGGTLGQQFEGLEGPLDEWFYHPVPDGMVPNDDLDVQVVYASTLASREAPTVDGATLAAAWEAHVRFPWNEYGVALRNLREGLLPPLTGSVDNWFACGEGAAIRSELWACLAPGDPGRAAAFAAIDASFDHAGDGIAAARYLAAAEAAAFDTSDIDAVLDIAERQLDSGTPLAEVVATVRSLDRSLEWSDARSVVVDRFAGSDFTDVRMNTGFLLIGLLWGRSFEESICITNNCGGDTDSSTASLAALLGILDPDSLPDRWLAPIGDAIQLSRGIVDLDGPATLQELTQIVADLRHRLPDPRPVAPADPDAGHAAVPVRTAWLDLRRTDWHERDLTELPPPGSVRPDRAVEWTDTVLRGTWATMDRAEFRAPILLISYSVDGGPEGRRAKIMINSTEGYRAWLGADFAHAAPPADYIFPAPHMAPVGQAFFAWLRPGVNELLLALKRPPAGRDAAEWIVAIVDPETDQWFPHSLRPAAAHGASR